MFILTAGAGALASTVAGGLLGGGSSGDSTSQGTQSRNPWEPAQPYLLRDLQTNQDLQDFYTKNPFNTQQKAGLQNTLNDADNFRSNVMPGLLSFANGAMGSNYQRQMGGAPGSGAGYGGERRAMQSGPAIRPTTQGAFNPTPNGQSFGQIDWNAINPFSAQNKPEAPEAAALPPEYQAMFDDWLLRQRQIQEVMYQGGDGWGDGGGNGGNGGAGSAGNAGSDGSAADGTGDGGPGGVGGW